MAFISVEDNFSNKICSYKFWDITPGHLARNMAFIGAKDISEFGMTHTGYILIQHGKKLF